MKENVFERKLYDALEQNINVPRSFSNSILTFDYKKKTKKTVKLYRKLAVVFSFFIISISLVVCAYTINESYKAKSSIGYVNKSLENAVEGGYIQNIDMNYAYSNKIGAKIDYIVMSDYNLNILFDFDISQAKDMKHAADIQDLLIYDENNDIIFCYNQKAYKEFCKKNKLECIDNFFQQQWE